MTSRNDPHGNSGRPGVLVSYTKEQLALCQDATIPDLVGQNCKLLFVGINPGLQTAMTGIHFAHASNRFWKALKLAGLIEFLPNISPTFPSVPIAEGLGQRPSGIWTAATQTHFSYPGNRFYPALFRGGVIDWEISPSEGMTDQDRDRFTARGLGISNVAPRATAKASELSSDELRSGAERLVRNVESWHPTVVAIAGITAYRTGFKRPKAVMGLQEESLGGAQLWVVPNPSGLNAHESVVSLADWYRQAAVAAGILVS